MNNLVVRTISGALLVSVIVASILLSSILFGIVFALVTSLATREFYSIIEPENKHNRLYGTIGGVLLFVSWLFVFNGWGGWQLAVIYPIYMIALLIAELFLKAENPIHNWAYLLMGQIMVALPFASLIFIYHSFNNPLVLLALFVIIWINDTGAYCVGSLMGKHKMFPRVSPKKSWEGLIGGFLFAMVAGWIFSMYANLSADANVNLVLWLVFAALVSVFGTLGDLMESLTKRTLGIKDSGNIIPGHGGMLDRFDSMLLAAPVVAIYLFLIAFV